MKTMFAAAAFTAAIIAASPSEAQQIEATCQCRHPCHCRNFGVDLDKIGKGGPIEVKFPLRVLDCLEQWCSLPERLEKYCLIGGLMGGAAAISSVAFVALWLRERNRKA